MPDTIMTGPRSRQRRFHDLVPHPGSRHLVGGLVGCSPRRPARPPCVTTAADRGPRADRVAHPTPPLRAVGAVRLAARRRSGRGRPRRDAVRDRRLGDDRPAAVHVARAAGPRTPRSSPRSPSALHIAAVFEHAADFDIIHNGFDFLPLTYSGLVDTPVVTTIHGFSSPRIVPVYERYDATTTYVAISDADRHPALHYAATIHHGIDTDAFAVDPSPASTCCSSAASTPTRAPRAAIEVAAPGRAAPGHRRDRPGRAATSTSEVAPHVDGDRVRYSDPSAPPTDRRCSAGARAAAPHRLRRAVRLQRRRGDGMRHARHRPRPGIDARADRPTA